MIHGIFGSGYLAQTTTKFWVTALLGSQLFVILWWWRFTYTFYINPPKGCQGEKWLKLLRKNRSIKLTKTSRKGNFTLNSCFNDPCPKSED